MISTFTSPSYVNRVQESWQPGYGVTQSGGAGGPTLYFDFLTGTLNPSITFTRASTATFFNSSGVLTSAAIDAPRFDYDPSTLAAQGLLIEEARTNSIRNNTMQGAVAGTPGTNPTNWVVGPTADGLTKEIVGTGTQNGITYVDIRWSGTSGAAATTTLFQCETQTQVAALNAQTWSGSMWVALVGGTLTNVNTLELRIRYNDGAGSILTQAGVTVATATSTMQRFSTAQTASNASTAFVNVGVISDFANSSAVDFTLRIGLPQLEQGAFATSVIPTTTTALTRSTDVAAVNTLSPWFNSTTGTIYAEVVGLMNSTLSGNRSIAAFSDNTYSNTIVLAKANGGATWLAEIVNGGATQASYSFNVYSQNATAKIALAYEANNFNAATNGTAGVTDTSGTIPTVTKLEFRDATGASGGQPTCYLRRITYYPRRLSNAELQAITA